jgi:hypothetical protein
MTMKPAPNPRNPEFATTAAARRMPRPFWKAVPMARVGLTNDLGHETEVMRGLTLAVPISLALWVPLILAASYLF